MLRIMLISDIPTNKIYLITFLVESMRSCVMSVQYGVCAIAEHLRSDGEYPILNIVFLQSFGAAGTKRAAPDQVQGCHASFIIV